MRKERKMKAEELFCKIGVKFVNKNGLSPKTYNYIITKDWINNKKNKPFDVADLTNYTSVFKINKIVNPTYIINIETATEICSIGLSKNGKTIALREQSQPNIHSQMVLPAIDELLQEANIDKKDLNAVAVSEGPGSYTGLRIGTSTAKGLCYALEIPLIAISTLKIIAYGTLVKQNKQVFYCPMIDARRMEVYLAIFDNQLNMLQEVHNEIIDDDSFASILNEKTIVFCGNAVEKVKPILGKYPNAIFENIQCSADYMSFLSWQQFNNQQFVDLAYFEPFYLKAFQSAVSKVKGLK